MRLNVLYTIRQRNFEQELLEEYFSDRQQDKEAYLSLLPNYVEVSKYFAE